MPAVTLNLRLSDNALSMLDELRLMKLDPHGAEISRERWVFLALRSVGGNWTQKWNLLQAHGSVVALQTPEGQLVVNLSNVPDLPVGEGSPNATLHVRMPDVVLELLKHAANINAAVRLQATKANPWPTVTAWAEGYLTDAIAIAHAALETERADAEVDSFEGKEAIEAMRIRRLRQLEEDRQAEPESSVGRVVATLSDPDGAPSSAAGAGSNESG